MVTPFGESHLESRIIPSFFSLFPPSLGPSVPSSLASWAMRSIRFPRCFPRSIRSLAGLALALVPSLPPSLLPTRSVSLSVSLLPSLSFPPPLPYLFSFRLFPSIHPSVCLSVCLSLALFLPPPTHLTSPGLHASRAVSPPPLLVYRTQRPPHAASGSRSHYDSAVSPPLPRPLPRRRAQSRLPSRFAPCTRRPGTPPRRRGGAIGRPLMAGGRRGPASESRSHYEQ